MVYSYIKQPHSPSLMELLLLKSSAAADGAAASVVGPGAGSFTRGPLDAYPCDAPTASRIIFLVARMDGTFLAAFRLPLCELWVPMVTTAILAQLFALLLMPRRLYMTWVRRVCMLLVGLLPKVVTLAAFLASPDERPNSYFNTYLPIEGAITIWQQIVYNYSLWPGIAVLATHCVLSIAICSMVTPRLSAAGLPAPFNPTWVMAHTYFCAALAVCATLLQHPTNAREVRAALRRTCDLAMAASARLQLWPSRCGRWPCRCGGWYQGLKQSSSGTHAGGPALADLHLTAAVRRLLSTSLSGCSGSTCSNSFTASSASVGSSAAPSEAGSAAGSGSHAAAAGVVQASRQATPCAGRPETAPTLPHQVVLEKGWQQQPQQLKQGLPDQQLVDVRPRLVARATQLAHGRDTGIVTTATVLGMIHAGKDAAASSGLAKGPAVTPATPYTSYTSPPSRAAVVATPPSGTFPPAGAFSLKQPTGLSKLTIVEDREFEAPAAVGVGVSMNAINHISARSRRFRRYQSRAPLQRVHMKIPWAEPEQLPGNFLERLNLALSEGLDCMAVGVSVRAGCIELVFDIVPQAAFDSATDFQAGQSRRRHARQHPPRAGPHFETSSTTEAQLQLPLQQQAPQHGQLQPGHLDLLGQVGLIGGGGSGSEEESDPHGALEAAVLSGLLGDAEPASWIEALHLQPPPGAEVLTQACGRVWISRWDHTLRQWVPERVGGIRPSQLPRITQVRPSCILVRHASSAAVLTANGDAGLRQNGGTGPGGPAGAGSAVVQVTVSNADGANAPVYSARCRGRYLPVVARRLSVSGGAGDAGRCESGDQAGLATYELELEPDGLPRNGLVILECRVGKLLSNWRPVIVTEDAHLAEELASLLAPSSSPPSAGPMPADHGDSACVMPLALHDLDSNAGREGGGSASGSDCDADAFGWDELHSDLGLWLDYLEVLGLTTSGSNGNSRRRSGEEGLVAAGSGGETGCGGARGPGGFGAEAVEAGNARTAGALDLRPGLAVLYSAENYRAHMAGIGVSLLEFAVDRGWSHTAGMLVGQMLSAGIPWAEVLRRCSDGLTLLHRAVRSGRGEMVQLVVQLGEQHGTPFNWQAASSEEDTAKGAIGSSGVTPLHLAASLADGGRLAERILREYQAACELWASAVDSYGMRPVDCARAFGHVHLVGETWNTHEASAPAVTALAVAPAPSGAPPGNPQRALTSAAPAQAAYTPPFDASTAAGTSTTASSTALMGCNTGDEVEAASGSVASVRRDARPPHPAFAVASTVTEALLGVAHLMTAPFVGDRHAEAAYVRAVGAEYVLWCCGYLVYQFSTVLAVAGRMMKELRGHEMGGMVLFCFPHVISAALLCADYSAWLRLREPLWVAVTVTRSLAKLLPAIGMLPYPASASNYLSGGMDVLLEGLIPAYFERMRAPIVLPLRALEGLATGLLYRSHRVKLRLAPEGVSEVAYAMAWTLGCGVITAALDVSCRRRLAAAVGAYSAGGGSRAPGARTRGSAVPEQGFVHSRSSTPCSFRIGVGVIFLLVQQKGITFIG
ncbi:hypothetical protein VOLCADRAFT_89960 [Volvox carteri f. nagariensis]|uniref:Uncharacterized protein n=1 Tax=Volvox carteri f. nagariensis TaxID=3068 RepID=D8TT42_VOLCA|nr:uncharacterized protein VOLCADRAFT_89960 [Volvox carteri f. nagariensis]EFJ49129.1 hypothetical protein VOLCADRAFT_89960 [Volvox carteri f. nagariensis]|eukprot:XP_002949577.1 hypothetical protein VOLCADRAFT_89960 [Volvox carteri f. nagariensis]